MYVPILASVRRGCGAKVVLGRCSANTSEALWSAEVGILFQRQHVEFISVPRNSLSRNTIELSSKGQGLRHSSRHSQCLRCWNSSGTRDRRRQHAVASCRGPGPSRGSAASAETGPQQTFPTAKFLVMIGVGRTGPSKLIGLKHVAK